MFVMCVTLINYDDIMHAIINCKLLEAIYH